MTICLMICLVVSVLVNAILLIFKKDKRTYSGRLIVVEDEDGCYTFLEFDEFADPATLHNGEVLNLEVRKKHRASNGNN